MKVAYLGAFAHSWSTEEHVARDAESLGITVDRIRLDELDELETRASEADLLVCHATGLAPSLENVWRRLEARGVKTASYHLDLYRGLRRWSQVHTDPFWRTGTVFTADGDPDTTAALAQLGINHRWLPAAVVSDETHAGRFRPEYDYDVVFVGAEHYPHPEWPWRERLVAGLRERYGTRFKLFGHHPPTRGRNLNDLYSTARVVVGDTLALPGCRNFTSDRLFETVGRGGSLVYPELDGLDLLGFSDEHVAFHQPCDLPDTIEHVDALLADPERARHIAQQGREFVRSHHTYRNRVEHLLASVGLGVAA